MKKYVPLIGLVLFLAALTPGIAMEYQSSTANAGLLCIGLAVMAFFLTPFACLAIHYIRQPREQEAP